MAMIIDFLADGIGCLREPFDPSSILGFQKRCFTTSFKKLDCFDQYNIMNIPDL